MKEELVMVAYVGSKPVAYDNVAKSGKSWAGNGDIQEVTPEQAQKLIRYPDQWALVDESDRLSVDAPGMVKLPDEDGDEVMVKENALRKPIEKMSKVELAALAKQRWGETIDYGLSKKQMIDQIEEWIELRPEVVKPV